jgi:hypothetical protein
MKERAVDVQRAVVAHDQSPEIAEPADRALDDPTSPVAPQLAPILGGRTNPPLSMGTDQLETATPQAFSQRITVVRLVCDDPHQLLPRTSRAMPPSYADRRQRFFREPDFCRGCRGKVVSQRNTLAVDHPHPLRPLAPLGFSDSAAPFFAGAKLPSRNERLHFSCWRSFNSLRNARQMFSQTPCSSQSRNRRQHVEGCGNFSGRSCQRAPLRRIHKIPSKTRRFSIHGRPPWRCLGGLGSKGAIFFHCASVSHGPDRATCLRRQVGPPSALLTPFMLPLREPDHRHFRALYGVVQQRLET